MGCDKRGDGDGDNNNIRRRSSEVVDEDEVPYTGLRTRVVCSTDRIRISRQQLKASRRELKKRNLLMHIPRLTKDDPKDGHIMVPTRGGPAICYVINGHAISAAHKRREAEKRREAGVVNQVMNPVAGSSQATATVGTKDEVEGGSFLKRACVNLGESSELVAGNLNPADPLAATGTVANVKGGYVVNKDLGESSEVLIESTEP